MKDALVKRSERFADVNEVSDIILGGSADADTRLRADVNEDGEINIADVNAIIGLITK